MIKHFLDLLDRGSWKHTAHMEKDEFNRIIWHHQENIDRIKEQIAEARKEAEDLRILADEAEKALKNWEKDFHV